MTREAVRQFGVELEGYFNSDMEGESFYVGKEYWNIKEDGSLENDSDSENCSACCGTGRIENSCPNDDCVDGEVSFTDSDGNDYDCECKTCNGTGEGESEECEECDGDGYVKTGRFGLEVVSPPIMNLDLISDVYHKMHNNGWEVDNDAGLHIHVDANDLTPKDFYKILLLMTAVEPIIFSINDSFRYEDCNYCYSLTNDTEYDVRKVLETPFEDINRMSDVYFSDSRYTALNYEAFRKHGTIEFRHFSPQTSASKVINYVELVTRLVDFAKYASYEQLCVAYKQIFDCKDFNIACDTLQELLELPFDLKAMKQNNLYRGIQRVNVDLPHNEAQTTEAEAV